MPARVRRSMTSPAHDTSADNVTPIDKSQDGELQRLRALLLRDDRNDLAELQDRLAKLDDRIGTDDAFRGSVETVLLEALGRVQQTRSNDLRRTLAPLVVSTIRTEVRNSREELVNALYPLTGKMVAAAMRDAVARLSDNINATVEQASNPTIIMARLKSRITGRPLAASVLRKLQGLKVDRAILMDGRSGTVLSSFTTAEDVDADMVGGLISALSTFASETYAHKNSDLRSIELEGHRLVLRHSPTYLLALEIEGELTTEDASHIDRLFLDLVTEAEDDAATIDDERIERLAEQVAETKTEKRRSIVMPIAALALIALTGYWAHGWWQSHVFDGHVADTRMALESREALTAYPVSVVGDFETRSINVSGLVPAVFDRTDFERLARAALPNDVSLSVNLERIDSVERVTARLDEAEQRLTDTEGGLSRLPSQIKQLRTQAAEAERLRLEEQEQSRQDAITYADAVDTRITALADRLTSQQTDIGENRRTTDEALTIAEKERATLETSLAQIDALRNDVRTINRRIDHEVLPRVAATGMADETLKQTVSAADARIEDLSKEMETFKESAAAQGELERQLSSANAEVEDLRTQVASLATQLKAERDRRLQTTRKLIDAQQIRFSRGATFNDAAAAEQSLQRIAELVLDSGLPLVISGHADGSGTLEAIERSARARAEAVSARLIELGVPTDLLTVQSMGDRRSTSEITGVDSPDRRVTFQTGEVR